MDEDTLQAVGRALLWFDRYDAPRLRADKMPEEGIEHLRRGYVEAVRSPAAVREHQEWFRAGMPEEWPVRGGQAT